MSRTGAAFDPAVSDPEEPVTVMLRLLRSPDTAMRSHPIGDDGLFA